MNLDLKQTTEIDTDERLTELKVSCDVWFRVRV